MATRLTIAEEIQRNYQRAIGAEDTADSIDRREIFPLINQVANEVLGVVLQAGMKSGSLQIPSSFIATYNNINVTVENGRYMSIIPVYPISLPRNIGVYSVVPMSAGLDGTPFIPITQEDWDILSVTDINDGGMLEGQIAYFVEGRKVFYTKNPIVSKVKMKIVISDPSLIGDNDLYPVTPEVEASIIDRVLGILKGNTRTNGNNNA